MASEVYPFGLPVVREVDMTTLSQGLSVRGARKSFGSVPVVKSVDVDFRRGEVTALMGENGAGKSTLLKLIAGIYSPDSISVTLDGSPLTTTDVAEAQSHGIAMVHQELNLVDNQTVEQNIFLGRAPLVSPRWMGLVDRREVRDRATAALERVGSVVRPDALVGDLSIAQKQQVEIAKALAQDDVSVLLLDEPTSSLPEEQAHDLLELLRGLRKQGLAIAITTHRLDEAFAVSDRFVVLRDGEKVAEFAGFDPKLSKDTVVEAMVGRELSTLFPHKRTAPESEILVVKGLTAGFVRDVSFTVRKGEIFGLGGLVGAGRTETARCIFGADPIESGSIILNGTELRVKNPKEAVQSGIGFVPEDRKAQGLVVTQDIVRNVALPNLRSWSRNGFLDLRRLKTVVADSIAGLRIRTRGPQQIVSQLSGGNQQKVVLSKWLARDLELLILDEPTRGVDVGARSDIYKQIDDIAAHGVAILLISSDMEELIGLSDRIGVMAEGRYMGTLDGDEVTQEAIIRLASKLESTPNSDYAEGVK